MSPDGRALVFRRSNLGLRGEIYRLNLTEDLKPQAEPERLSFVDRWSHSPVWTPDGRDILFVSQHAFTDSSLWRMAASNPGPPGQLAFAGQRAFIGLDLSRHSARLAYSVIQADSNIWRIQLGKPGAEPKAGEKFIESSQVETEPDYAPNGKRIAFQSSRSGASEIWISDSDGSHLQQLTSFGGPLTNRPRWSPDGQQVVFYSDATGNRDIYIVRADGGGVPRQLTTDPSIDTNPEWSADGNWIYFSSERSGQQASWKVPAAGGEAVAVPNILGARESPDGKFLYFGKGWPKEFSLWRTPVGGAEETLVADSLHPEGGLVIKAEGMYFISKPDEKGVSHIRFKDLASGEVRTIAPIGSRVFWGLSVSPDERWILYSQADQVGSDLMLVENFR